MATPKRNIRVSTRDREIFRMYVRHKTQQRIADELDMSQRSVSEAIKRARSEIPVETKQEQRAQMATLLDEFVAELVELVERDPIPAYSNGRPIVIEAGQDGEADVVAMDYSTRIRAMEVAKAMIESKRKMFGLDEPTKTSVDSTVRFEVVGIDTKELT